MRSSRETRFVVSILFGLATTLGSASSALATSSPDLRLGQPAAVHAADAIPAAACACWIQGTVYAANGTTPLQYVIVTAGNPMAYNAVTDANGHYAISVPDTGAYTVSFNDPFNRYLNGYYDADVALSHFTISVGALTTVNVTGTSTLYNVWLGSGIHITGKITDTAGTPLAAIQVLAYIPGGYQATSGTPENGTYSILVPPSASYTVAFNDQSGTFHNCYYDSAVQFSHMTWDYTYRTPVAVGASGSGDVAISDVAMAKPWSVTLQTSRWDTLVGTSVTLTATANQALDLTPYYIAILDDQGTVLNSPPCGGPPTCTATVTSDTPVSRTYHAVVGYSDGSSPLVTSNTVSVNWANPDHLHLIPMNSSILAGGSRTYTAEAFDSDEDDLGDVTSATTFAITGGGSCSGATCSTIVAGTHTVIGTDGSVVGTTSLFVGAATATHLVLSPAEATIGAGFSHFFVAYEADVYGNLGTEVSSASTFSVVGGTCSGAICTSTHVGDHLVTATDGALTGTAILHTQPGLLDQLVLSPSGATIVAGTSKAYTAAGFDGFGNSIGDETGSTTFTMTGGSCTGAVCTGRTAGDQTVTATNGKVTGTTIVHVTPAAATHLTLTGLTTPRSASSAGSLTVKAKDAYGNTATGYRGKVHFTSTDAAAVLPADYSFAAGDAGVHSCIVTLKTTGTHSVSATDLATASITGTQTGIVVTPAESRFHLVTPVRVLDTRAAGNGVGAGRAVAKLTAGTPVWFQVTGRTDRTPLIPAGATAVTGNLTVTGSSAAGSVYLGPISANPGLPTIDFSAGQTIANGVTLGLGSGGKLYATFTGPAGATTDLVFDVTGYFAIDTTGLTYHPIDPIREVDTRIKRGVAAKVVANVPTCFAVAGAYGLSSSAKAITGSVTVVTPSALWALYLGPVNTATPTTSTINFLAGQTTSNNLAAALDANGKLCATYLGPAGASMDLVFDVTGYYTADSSGLSFVPVNPFRLVDTTTKTGLPGKIAAASFGTFGVSGHSPIAANATGVTGNLTALNETSSWAIYLGPTGDLTPATSNLNFDAGVKLANGFTVALSSTGTASATYLGPAGATTDLWVDITGYFVK